MKPAILHHARLFCFVAAPTFLLSCLSGAPVWAQDKTATATASASPKDRTNAPALFSLDLKATPLRQAIVSLLTNAQAQYTIAEDVPDTPVTLTIKDKTVFDALQLLVWQVKSVAYTVRGNVIQIQTKTAPPVVTEPMRTDIIHLSSVRPSDVMGRLQTAFPTALILPGTDASSLLVRGSAQQNQDVRELASLLDTAPKTILLRAEVVMVADGGNAKTKGKGRSTILSTNLRTLSGQEATGDEKLMGSPAQSVRLQLNATPFFLGDATVQVDTRWDISIPLPNAKMMTGGGKGVGLVRLEKRMTTTTRLQNAQTALVGSVLLSQYGLKGEILFFVTANVIGGQ